MKVPMLILDRNDRVHRLNAAARDLLGDCVGQACAASVQAREPSGKPVCTSTCASMLHIRDGEQQADHRYVLINGRPYHLLCNDVGGTVVVSMLPAPTDPPPAIPLSNREREVLSLARQGLTDQRIAERLGIGAASVRTYVERARKKLGASNRVEAVARAQATGEIP